MRPLFFIHIPKTGGTSFRLAAQAYYTDARIVFDYGKTSDTTSQLVQNRMYDEPGDPWAFGRDCERLDIAMISGHVPINRYVPLVGVCNTVTFVRSPLQRIASEYAHFLRHKEYKDSFREFYSSSIMQNRQSRLLRGVPLEAIGLVGITERYAEGLNIFNERYRSDLPYRTDNRSTTDVGSEHGISPEDEAALHRLNRDDVVLYERADRLFEARMAMYGKGLPYAHACLVGISAHQVGGWAWWADGGNAPVAVEVWINGSMAGTAQAVEFRPNLRRLGPPRGGFVGFHLPATLAPGDEVQCRVADTGQRFPAEPARVPEPGA